MHGFDRRILALLKQQREKPEKFRPERDSNPYLCEAGAVLHQLSYRAHWELTVMWVDYKPADVKIDDADTRIFHVFEIWIGMNGFDHRILVLFN